MNEPEPFELSWRSGPEDHERLASPLVVKAMPLADGTFVPCALWLDRSYPADGEVVLVRKQGPQGDQRRVVVPQSAAPFDRLVAPGDRALFAPLADAHSLREAFLGWLRATQNTKVVAP